MDITGVVHSIKGRVGISFFGSFHHEVCLYHFVITGRRISYNGSKDYIIFIESRQLSIVSRYVTGITLAYLTIAMI